MFQPSGAVISQAGVNFRLEVWDKAATCILYAETHAAQDLSLTKGGFSLELGKGSSPTNYLESSSAFTAKIFQNSGAVAGGWANCASGTNLASGDNRLIRVYYDLGGGFVAMSPDVPITASAYAMVAETLQGKAPADLIQVKDDVTTDLTQANVENVFSSTNYARLQQLLNPTASLSFGSQRLTNISDPSSAQDAATKNYSDTRLAGQTIDLVDVAPGFGGGKVLTWDSAQNKWVAQAPTLSGTAGGDLTGSYPNPTIAAAAIGTSKMANDAVTSAKINSTGIATNRLLITDSTTGATVTYANCANNEILRFVTGTGWQCTTVSTLAPVTSVAGKTGVVTLNAADISGLGTAATRNIGTAMNDVPELLTGGKLGVSTIPLFLGDVTGSIDANVVTRLQGRDVASTAPNANEVLRWNGSRWEPQALTDNGITALTGDISASGNGSVAATLTNGVVTTPKMFTNPGTNRLVATDGTSGATLVPFTCNLNEIVQWGASGWACASIATAVGGNVIVNSGNTFGAAMTIGTNDAQPLYFESNNTPRMTVLANGNVGIGTTAPAFALDVTGAINASGYIYGGRVYSSEVFGGSGASANLTIDSTTSVTKGNVFIAPSGGYVGVGTNTPGRLLDVAGVMRVQPSALPGSPGAGDVAIDSGAGNALKYYNGSTWISLAVGATGDFKADGTIPMTGNLNLNGNYLSGDGGNEGLFVDSTGNVGVGTTNPNRLFEVAGPVRLSPAALPGTPGAGDLAIDSGAGNALKYYNGSAWISLAVGGTGDFKADGSVPMTAAFRSVAGSAAAPGLTFVGDTDNGIFAPAADVLALTTSGSEKLRVDAAGYVGVGTTNPGALLDLASGSEHLKFSPGSTNSINTTSNSLYVGAGGTNNLKLSGTSTIVQGTGTNSTYAALDIQNSANTSIAYFRNDGYVGVGTTNPNRILEVAGPVRLSPAALPGTPGAGDMAIDSGAGNALKYYNGSAWISLAVGGTGDFKADGTIPMTGNLRLNGNYLSGDGGTEGLFVDSTGNVGVGTSNPNRLFEVAGPVRLSPAALPGTPGAGDMAIDSGAGNALKYYNGSSWISLAVGGTGDFKADGSVPMTAALRSVAGSAATPGYTFVGDTDNGIFAPAADTFAIATSGAERLRVDSSGNIGIGTTLPSRTLDVAGVMRVQPSTIPGSPSAGDLVIDAGAGNSLKYHNGSTWISLAVGGTGDFKADGTVPMTGNLRLNNNWLSGDGGNEGVFVTSAGNVGIGTTNPTYLLDVAGNGQVNGNFTISGNLYAPLIYGGTAVSQNLTIDSTTNATKGDIFIAPSGGNVGIGTSLPSRALEVSGGLRLQPNSLPGSPLAGDFAIDAGAGNALKYHNGSNWISLAVGGTGDFKADGSVPMTGNLRLNNNWLSGDGGNEGVFVTSTGNVGIGTTAPNRLLDVAGPVRLQPAALPGSPLAGDLAFDSGAGNLLKYHNGTAWVSVGSGDGDFMRDGSVAMTGAIRASAGTTASPGYTFAGDTDNGLFAPGSDTLALSTSGNERFRVTATGFVGIGTTAPNRLLDVAGLMHIEPTALPGSPIAGDFAIDAGAGNSLKYHNGSTWISLAVGGTGDFKADGSVPMTGNLRLNNNWLSGDGGNEGVFVTSAGNVGIGTTNPTYLLDVAGNGQVNGNFFTAGNLYAPLIYGGTAVSQNLLIDSTTNATKGNIFIAPSGGNVGIGTSLPSRALEVSGGLRLQPNSLPGSPLAGDFAIDAGAGNALKYHNGSAWISLAVGGTGDFKADGTVPMTANLRLNGNYLSGDGGTEGLFVDSTGNVGVGTSNPNRLFEVAGPVRLSPAALPGTPGAGDMAIDSGAGNALKYYNGSTWISLAVGGTGDFKADGSVPMTAALRSVAGSAATPGYTFVGDTDNGIFAPSADTFAIATSGAERLRVDSSGNIGIGTTLPSRTLDVAGVMRVQPSTIPGSPSAGDLVIDAGAGNALKYHNGSNWISLAVGGTGDFKADGSVPMTGNLRLNNNWLSGDGGNEGVFVTSAGNVGIGTTNPVYSLDVGGAGRINGNLITVGDLYAPLIYGGTVASQNLTIDSTTNATKGNIFIAPSGGNVGIGTSLPSRALEVSGGLRLQPNSLPGSPLAGDFAIDAGAGNALKYHNGSTWISLAVGGTGDFKADGTIPMTGALRATAGTSSAPGYTFVGDTDNGLFAPASDTLALSTSGSERVRVTSAGLVGIGTTNPSQPLDVNGNALIGNDLTVTGNSYGQVHYGGTGANSFLKLFSTSGAGSGDFMAFYTGNSTERVRIDTSGNVGIGTTSPNRLLDVAGLMHIQPTALPGSPVAGDLAIDAGAGNSLKYHNGSSWISLAVGGTGDFKADGTIPMTGVLRALAGSASAPGYTFVGDTDNGIFAPAADTLAIGTSGSEKLRVTPLGYVGIGTTNPSHALDVVGALQLTGQAIANSTLVNAGSAGSPSYSFSTATTSGFYAPAVDQLGLVTASTDRLRVLSNGYVGVGTTSPNRLLEVAGPIRLEPSALPSSPAAGDLAIDSGANNALKYNNGSSWVLIGSGTGDFMSDGSVAMSAALRAVAGSASSPGYTFVGDTDNGIFAPAADTLAIGTSGTEKLRITAAGYVGVATSTPGYPLDIKGDARAQNNLFVGTAGSKIFDTAGNLTLSSFNNSILTNSGANLQILNGSGNPNVYLNGVTNGASYFASGNVGVGTTSPQRLLEVAGPIRITPAALPGSPTAGDLALDSGASNALKYHNGTSWVSIGSGTGDFMSDGSVAMSAALRAVAGSASAPGYTFVGDTDNGIFAPAADTLAIGTSGSEKLRVTPLGYVGIGTTNPGYALQVGDGVSSTIAAAFYTSVVGAAPAINLVNQSTSTDRGPAIAFSNNVGILGQIAMTRGANANYSNLLFYSKANEATATEKMRLDSTGYLGIGTTTPARLLHVAGPIRVNPSSLPSSPAAGDLAFDSSAGNALKYHNGASWVAIGSGTGDFMSDGSVAMAGNLRLNNNWLSGDGGSEGLFVDSSGKVGVGTTSPSRYLDVVGPIHLQPATLPSSPAAGDLAFDSGAANALKYHDGSNWVTIGSGTGDFKADGSVPMTAALRTVAGNASAPGFTFVSDTDNGIFAPAADTLAIGTSGSEKLRVTSSGFVGIGTTNPASALDVYSGGNQALAVGSTTITIPYSTASLNSTTGALVISGGLGVGGNIRSGGNLSGAVTNSSTYAPTGSASQYPSAGGTLSMNNFSPTNSGYSQVTLSAKNSSSNSQYAYMNAFSVAGAGQYSPTLAFGLSIGTSSYQEYMRLDSTGNVGIGTSNPTRLLDVAGIMHVQPSVLPSSPAAGDLAIDSGAGNALKYHNGSSWISLAVGGTGDFKADGTIPMTGAFRSVAGSVSAPGMTIVGDTDTGIFAPAADILAIGTSGVERMRFLANGNIGIGLTSPSWPLEVSGNVKFGGQVYAGSGLASSPSYSFGSSSATGMYYPGSNALGFSTNAVEKMRIDTNGNVGIGTTSPARLLQVAGPVRITPTTLPSSPTAGDLAFDSGASNALKYHDGSNWVTIGSGTGDFKADGTISMTGNLRLNGNYLSGDGGNEGLFVDSTGKVGVGTTNPNRLFEVAGPIRITPTTLPSSPAAGDLAFDSGASNALKYHDGSNWVTIGSGTGDFKADGTVAMTGALQSLAGSASAPGITFAGDTNTGMFNPSADNLAIGTSGVERMRILSSGLVGIGITNPTTLLTVSSSSGTQIAQTLALQAPFGAQDYGTSLVFRSNNNVTYGQIAGVRGTASNQGYLSFYSAQSGSLNESMRIDQTGYVGIGTTTPARLLQVAGPMRITPATLPSSPAAGDLAFDSGASNALKYHDGSNWVTIGSGTGDFKADGTVAMTAALRHVAGSASAPGMTFVSDTDNGIFAPASDTLAIGTSGVERMRVLSTGYVGVGTTNPTRILEVNGALGLMDNNVKTYNGGVTSEASGQLVDFGINDDGTNRFGGSYTSARQGGLLRIDARNAQPLFSFLGRAAGSTSSMSTLMIIDSSGNVGIGTTSAARALHVAGPIRVTPATLPGSPAAGDLAFDSGASNALKYHDGSNWVTIGSGTGDFKADGSVVMTAALRHVAGSASAPGVTFVGDTDNGIFAPAADVVGIATSGLERLRISSAGYVGIGLTNPSYPLDVSGNARIGNNLTVSSNITAATVEAPQVNGGSGATSSLKLYSTSGTGTSDYIGFYTGSSSLRMMLDTNGNLGVGTSSPARLLHVAGPMRITPDTLPSSPAAGDLAFDSGASNTLKFHNGSTWVSVGSGSASGLTSTSKVTMNSDSDNSGSDGGFDFQRNGVNLATITNGGTMGVGTTSPTHKFSVVANIADDATSVQNLHGAGASDTVYLDSSGVSQMEVGYSNPSNAYFGGYSFIYSKTGTHLAFENDSNIPYVFFNTTSGSVGVGTTSPARLLHVNGPMRLQPAALPSSPAAGDLAFDSGASNALKYHNGSSWVSLTAGGTGDFKADGSVVMTAALRHVAGTASAPGVTFVGDTDNGIFAPAADVLAIGTSGSERMRISSTGYVGIGTSSPSYILSLDSSSARTIGMERVSSGVGMGLTLQAASAVSGGTDLAGGNLNLQTGVSTGTGTASINFLVTGPGTTGSTDRPLVTAMTITEQYISGVGNYPKVGIGSTSPSDSLEVIGGANGSSSGHITIKNTVNGGNSYGGFVAYNDAGTSGLFGQTSSSAYTQYPVIGANSTFVLGVAAGGMTLATSSASAPMKFATGGTTAANERMRLDSSGNLGIGTTTPARLLHVTGPIRVTPATLPGSPAAGDLAFDSGASNTLKFHNGASWVTVGSGSGDFKADGSVAMTGNIQLNSKWLSGDGGNEGVFVDSSGFVGVGTTTPQGGLDIATTGTVGSALIVPRDTTANRPSSPVNGMIRYNSTTGATEMYSNNAWGAVAKSDAPVNLTNQSANISTTTIVTPAVNSVYQINCMLTVTTAAGTSATAPSVRFTWTDPDSNYTYTALAICASSTNNTVGQVSEGIYTASVKAGSNLQFDTTGYASNPASAMKYALKIRVLHMP